MIYLKKQIAAEKKAQSASAPAQKPMPVSQPATTVAQDASNPVAESQASPVDVLNKLSPTEGIPSDPGVGATIRQLANSSQVDKANTDNIQ